MRGAGSLRHPDRSNEQDCTQEGRPDPDDPAMRHGATMLAMAFGAFGCSGDPSRPADVDGSSAGSPDAAGEPPPDAGPSDSPDAAPTGDPTVTQLLELLAHCDPVSSAKYSTDFENAASIDVCGLNGAVFWKSDFDIDCDGKRTAVCNEQTDGAYQPRTSANDSHGDPLDASQLPYAVIPLPSSRWRYEDSGIDLGQVLAVIHDGKLEYAVFGDQGPDKIIGEGSYRLAQLLGIDPDPSNGGTDGPVYFITFTGADARVDTIEDHAEAVSRGAALVDALIQAN